MVTGDGFYDTYCLANMRDEGFTVTDKIDGWENANKKRIDYIFCNFTADIKYSKTIFDGKNYAVVSDHFGVMTETES